MADPLATSTARFRIWIRRRPEPQGPYSIRFEVTEGKGILRVVRPGVLVDPPARPSGFEERLTATQVNTSRFLHAWDGGRYRQGHSFARLDEAKLEALPADRWIGLESAAEGTLSMLLLPDLIEPEAPRVDDEPTWPRRQMLAELQRELRELDTREPVPGDDDRTEVRPAPQLPPVAAGVDTPAPLAEPRTETGDGRSSRAERVEIPRAVASAKPAPPQRAAWSLEALLNASVPNGPARGMDDEQTVLMGGAAFADAGAHPPGNPALPRLAPVPMSSDDEHGAIEAGEASDEDGDDFEVVSVDSRHALLEALEAHEDDDDPVVEDLDVPEVTDIGRMPAPEVLHRAHLTEPVTVVPLFASERAAMHDVGDLVEILPSPSEDTGNFAIEAGDAGDAGEADEGDPQELAPTPAFHERNTTLVRFLRRRIASDRVRIAGLEQRVADLEQELLRRSAR